MTDKTQKLKERMLADISELFLVYGLRSTSMDDICAHLKISKKTLYQFFDNKDDVVEQVAYFRLWRQRLESNVEELLLQNPVRFLYNIKAHFLHYLSSRLPANIFDMKKYHPEVAKRIQEDEKLFIGGLLTKALTAGMQDGYFRKDMEMEVQIFLFVRQMNLVEDSEMSVVTDYPVSTLINTIVDDFILAITTEKGRIEFRRIGKEENG